MKVLFVANYPPSVGYAWSTIEQLFDGVAERLSEEGIGTLVAYPPTKNAQTTEDRDRSFRVVEADFSRATKSPSGLLRWIELLRDEDVSLLYLTDQASWSPLYPVLRGLGGIRYIVLHNRTSGARSPSSRVHAALKWGFHRIPGLAVDLAIGVSRFVTRRMINVNSLPSERVTLVYNGIDVDRFRPAASGKLRSALGIADDRPLIFFSGRARWYKGWEYLLAAASRLPSGVVWALCGDGPELADFQSQARERRLSNVHFLGRRDDIPQLLPDATLAVVPSVWEEAFGLTVVEAMSCGVPVIASDVGGIPEIIEDGVSGRIVPPADAEALAAAIEDLLSAPETRSRMGEHGRRQAVKRYSIERTCSEVSAELTSLLKDTIPRSSSSTR